eukprot:1270189-Amorphochlora_amoeboformis.AAC.1
MKRTINDSDMTKVPRSRIESSESCARKPPPTSRPPNRTYPRSFGEEHIIFTPMNICSSSLSRHPKNQSRGHLRS